MKWRTGDQMPYEETQELAAGLYLNSQPEGLLHFGFNIREASDGNACGRLTPLEKTPPGTTIVTTIVGRGTAISKTTPDHNDDHSGLNGTDQWHPFNSRLTDNNE